MIAPKENCKQLIDFLICRWRMMIDFATVERIHNALCQHAEKNNLPIPKTPMVQLPNGMCITVPQACHQITIIKHRIIEILPEARFIDYNYEAPAPLDPNDFAEMFVADHHQCIAKVEEVIKRIQIT